MTNTSTKTKASASEAPVMPAGGAIAATGGALEDIEESPSIGLFDAPFMFAALRCVARYILLPVVLPLLGVAANASAGILLMLDVIAAIAIVVTLRRLWRVQHRHRWQYLFVALALAVLVGFFFLNDAGVQ